MSQRNRRKDEKPGGARSRPSPAASALGNATALLGRAAERPWFLPALLVVFTLAVWARSFAVPFLRWDDTVYVFGDARLNDLSPANVVRIFTRPYFANYHPVTTLTYAFDRAVWGRWAPGYHATQLAFYASGVALIFYLFRAILGSRNAAFAAAAIYSAHAIHVEAVAWLAQRKDVVCLVFYAASILAYVRYARGRERPGRFYAAALALAALAMLSKGYAVVLPGVFVAYDLCFAERFRRRQVVDKLPFVLLAALATAATVFSQDEASALVPRAVPVGQRLAALAKVYAVYVGRSLLPVRLCAKYAVTPAWLGAWAVALGVILAGGAIAGFVLLGRRLPSAAFGIALFVLPLATVMNSFWQLRIWMTDRYLFFPTMGSSLALVAAFGWLLRRRRLPAEARRIAPAAATVGVLALYSALTVARTGVWTSGVALWSDTIRKQMRLGGSGPVTAQELLARSRLEGKPLDVPDPDAFTALADAYAREGNAREAEELRSEVSQRGEGETGVEFDLARRDVAAGRLDEAAKRLRVVIEGRGWFAPDAWSELALVLGKKGDHAGARRAHAKAVELLRARGSSATEALLAYGTSEFRRGEFLKAAELYGEALREGDPGDPRPVFYLGLALDGAGKPLEAYERYERTLEFEGDTPPGLRFSFADVHKQMGKTAAEKLGRAASAARHYEEVLRRVPGHPERDALRASIRSLKARAGARP